jgi:nicotinamide riboside kinase
LGVVYIGDRSTGKTHLALELINPKSNLVTIEGQNYQRLRQELCGSDDKTSPTNFDPINVGKFRSLEVKVKLPNPVPPIPLDWIDTPGEMWRKSWQGDNQQLWQKVLPNIQQSEGIMLILPPHRGMVTLKQYDDNIHRLPTQQQWVNRFKRWADFFRYQCPKARHIVICLNKADLFTDIERESQRLSYNSNMNWHTRNMYVIENYFNPVKDQLKIIAQNNSGLIRCFITTIYNRELLELPWIYLGSHLAS